LNEQYPVDETFKESIKTIRESKKLSSKISEVIDVITKCYQNGNKTVILEDNFLDSLMVFMLSLNVSSTGYCSFNLLY